MRLLEAHKKVVNQVSASLDNEAESGTGGKGIW